VASSRLGGAGLDLAAEHWSLASAIARAHRVLSLAGLIDREASNNAFSAIDQSQESVMKTIGCLVATALGGLALSSTMAQGPSTMGQIKDPYGSVAPEAQAERTIQIGPNTRWVNVNRMETVRFVIDPGGAQKTFTWRFDALPLRPFSLSAVAPAGALGPQQVTVYVARNRYLDGGGR